MKRFEYRTELIPHTDGTYHHDLHVPHDKVDELLNRLGAEGWEVWALDGSMVRLRREVADSDHALEIGATARRMGIARP